MITKKIPENFKKCGKSMNKIEHIYDCGVGNERFQFVNIDSLDEEKQESFTQFLENKSRPIVEGFKNIAYTWDYYKWLRKYNEFKKGKRSINERGLGYCGACGELVTLDNVDEKWVCRKCGYKNRIIFDHHYKRY